MVVNRSTTNNYANSVFVSTAIYTLNRLNVLSNSELVVTAASDLGVHCPLDMQHTSVVLWNSVLEQTAELVTFSVCVCVCVCVCDSELCTCI